MARARARGNSKQRATVTSTPCVQVTIKGYKRPPKTVFKGGYGMGPLPTLPDDGGLVHELQTWLMDQEIYSIHTPSVGGGQMVAYFEPEDAEKVLAWLAEHNKQ